MISPSLVIIQTIFVSHSSIGEITIGIIVDLLMLSFAPDAFSYTVMQFWNARTLSGSAGRKVAMSSAKRLSPNESVGVMCIVKN